MAKTRTIEAKTSPTALAARALRDAENAERGGDAKALAAAIERALYAASEAATGLKGRGVLLQELAARLEERGVAPELARSLQATLVICERARFDPHSDVGALGASADAGGSDGSLVAAARDQCRELAKMRSRAAAEASA
jgi:hypothetical protein